MLGIDNIIFKTFGLYLYIVFVFGSRLCGKSAIPGSQIQTPNIGTDPAGFEPAIPGLEGRCFIRAKPRAHLFSFFFTYLFYL